MFLGVNVSMGIIKSIRDTVIDHMPSDTIWNLTEDYIGAYKEDNLEKAIDEALDRAEQLKDYGICTTMDILGESVQRKHDVGISVTAYNSLIDQIAASSLKGTKFQPTVSLKLSSLTPIHILDSKNLHYESFKELLIHPQGEKILEQNVESILKHAKEKVVFVTIDMEHFPWVKKTFELHNSMRAKGYGIGMVHSAKYLDTDNYLDSLPANSTIRVVTGVIREPGHLAHTRNEDIKDKYFRDVCILLKHDHNVQIATHDPVLRRKIVNYIVKERIEQNRVEFQGLYGVGDTEKERWFGNPKRYDAYQQLVNGEYAQGFNPSNVRLYLPIVFNRENALAYLRRRAKNRPDFAVYAVKRFLGISGDNDILEYYKKHPPRKAAA